MPVYEEKVISPLAIRFTQEHIRTTFRDSRVVEETIKEIRATPSTVDDYDLVLEAPFPAIEILRWSPALRESEDEEATHWFTLDNRRLYCLQRAAVEHWPKRVAAKVEILYTDPGTVWRKYDSTTFGAAVTVSHSCKEAPLFTWDWNAVLRWTSGTTDGASAQAAIDADDQKEQVDDLVGTSDDGPDSILARALAFEMAIAEERQKRGAAASRSTTPSTAPTSEDSEEPTPRGCKSEQARGQRAIAERAVSEIDQQLLAPGFDGQLRLPQWRERYGNKLGPLRQFLESQGSKYTVLHGKSGRFSVWMSEENVHDDNGEQETLAAAAITEIFAQLGTEGRPCCVKIHDWRGRYANSLGAFRDFVRSQPDKFVAVSGPGNSFKVALASVQRGDDARRGHAGRPRARRTRVYS